MPTKSALLLASIALAIGGLTSACSKSGGDQGAQAAAAPQVPVAQVVVRELAPSAEFNGSLSAPQSVELRPRVSGAIVSVHVPEGVLVRKGQLLFRIDPRPFQVALDQAQAQLRQAQASATLAESNFTSSEQLVATGAISRKTYDDALAQRNAARAQVQAGSAAVAAARLDLSFTQVTAPVGGRVDRVPSDLLARRPDIRAVEHTLRAANANIGAARSAFFPTISLTGSAGTASASLDDLFSSGSGAWSFMPRITLPLPIFGGSALRANLDRADVQKRIEIANYEKAIQSAFRDVADGLAGKGTLDAQIRSETQRVDASRNAYRLAEQRLNSGEDDNLALLDAQRTLYGSQQALVRSKLVRLSNLINLYKALGGGWTEFTTPPDDPLAR